MFLECEVNFKWDQARKFPQPFNFLSQVIISATSEAASTENKEENNITLYFISFMT